MFLKHSSLHFVLGMILGGAVALPAASAFAADAISFAPGNPWSQTIGSISRSSNFQEYTVTADAGQTLQINLISRSPNLFFRVVPADSRKPLVDTMNSGATTWTTKPEATATYTVRVYEDPAAAASGDVTKYALQVGVF
ncbi:MAG TPA: hypothetical protein VFP88_02960 [Rhodanobacteraceae bacterium]|nr:hypothetical protein [Rhodanobacteraceae bacterium]